MTERLADISARIEGVRQLGAVVNAMKGIAAARAHQARAQVAAVDSYARTIAAGLSAMIGHEAEPAPSARGREALLVFCAEQGFAGSFSERVLDSIDHAPDCLFLVGTRGQSVAAARGLHADWTAAMPSHSSGIPRLADHITTAIYDAVARGRMDRLDVVFTGWREGRNTLVRQGLFPIVLDDLPETRSQRPLTQLPQEMLVSLLGQDYFNAQVCKAALHAFAAENQARMEAMASAARQISQELEGFEATLRRVRQEEITAEIIELGTGAVTAGQRDGRMSKR